MDLDHLNDGRKHIILDKIRADSKARKNPHMKKIIQMFLDDLNIHKWEKFVELTRPVATSNGFERNLSKAANLYPGLERVRATANAFVTSMCKEFSLTDLPTGEKV